jgi:DUF917 family protein
VAEAVTQTGGGAVMFCDKISDYDWRTEDGFTLGSVTIEGSRSYGGQTYGIDLKNENLVDCLNEAVDATIPVLICLIETETGRAVTNSDCKVGMQVSVLNLPPPEQFTTARGLATFGPAYLGLE